MAHRPFYNYYFKSVLAITLQPVKTVPGRFVGPSTFSNLENIDLRLGVETGLAVDGLASHSVYNKNNFLRYRMLLLFISLKMIRSRYLDGDKTVFFMIPNVLESVDGYGTFETKTNKNKVR